MNNASKKQGTFKMTWFVMAISLFFVSVFSNNLQFPFLILEEHKEEHSSVVNHGDEERVPFTENNVPIDFEENDTNDSSNEEESWKDKVVKINEVKGALGVDTPLSNTYKRIAINHQYYSNIILDITSPPPRA